MFCNIRLNNKNWYKSNQNNYKKYQKDVYLICKKCYIKKSKENYLNLKIRYFLERCFKEKQKPNQLKICIKCGIILIKKNWHKANRIIDYHICKNCVQKKSRKYFYEHKKERICYQKNLWKDKKFRKKMTNYYMKKYHTDKEFNRKQKTRMLTTMAKISGKIKKKDKCEICDSTKNLEFHHLNYDNPLLCMTICRKCHGLIHSKFQKI